jgi:hypothetical protein
MAAVVDNPARGRFELEERGLIAFARYQLRDGVLVIPHVEAPEGLRGSGAAGRLMEGLLSIARERGLKVRPTCPYAASYLERHAEHRDLLV